MRKKTDPLEVLVERIDELDSPSRASLIFRLARERRLLNTVISTLREGVIVTDSGGKIEFANPSSREMLGIQERDVGNLTLWRAIPDLGRTLKMNSSGYMQEGVTLTRELELTYPDRRTVRLYLVPIEETVEEVQLERYAVILTDVTREREQTLQEINDERVKSVLDLAAGVAHELGNPLNSLNIHLQLMERQMKKLQNNRDFDKLRKSLDICSTEVGRLDSIITHFLEAVRPRDPDFSDLDILSPLEETIEFLGPELDSVGIRVDLQVDNDLPVIQGDRNQLKQVFFNIIKNARQAIKSGGNIKIRVFSDDEYVYIQTGDSGEGISKENLRKVFQPYFSTKKSGHGLGMMIVERIMRDHGGQIGIDSRPGVGTLVTLQFPQKHRRIRLLRDE